MCLSLLREPINNIKCREARVLILRVALIQCVETVGLVTLLVLRKTLSGTVLHSILPQSSTTPLNHLESLGFMLYPEYPIVSATWCIVQIPIATSYGFLPRSEPLTTAEPRTSTYTRKKSSIKTSPLPRMTNSPIYAKK